MSAYSHFDSFLFCLWGHYCCISNMYFIRFSISRQTHLSLFCFKWIRWSAGLWLSPGEEQVESLSHLLPVEVMAVWKPVVESRHILPDIQVSSSDIDAFMSTFFPPSDSQLQSGPSVNRSTLLWPSCSRVCHALRLRRLGFFCILGVNAISSR